MALFAAGCAEPARAESDMPAEAPAAVASVQSQDSTEESTGAGAEVAAEPAAPARWPAMELARMPAGARVYSKVRFMWIRPEPKYSSDWIGYLSLGESAPLRGGSVETAFVSESRTARCHSWYALEPKGYVCVGEDATLDATDPDIVELQKHVARRSSPLPYDYGESLGTTVYLNVPPKKRQFFREPGLPQHLEAAARVRAVKTPHEIAAIDERFVGVDLTPTGNPAPTLLLHLGPRTRTRKTEVVLGSTIAYPYAFDADDRSWIMTWDRGIVPKDRVRPFPTSSFHGVGLDDDVKLPVAFFRQRHPKFRRAPDGTVSPVGEHWERYQWVQLTGEEVKQDGKRYLVTRTPGLLCGTDDVSVARLRTDLPPRIAQQKEGRRTWLDISVLRGWLVAYEYDRPVYATMVAPGRGGIPKDGVDPLETASTPVGRFRITAKFVTATMVSNANAKVVHSEVPYTQNFSGPYALHAAYWHDDWGVGKSGGCVNLSPIDARRLFRWTDPQLPPGWHGVKLATGYLHAKAAYDQATLVSLHR